MTIEAVPIAQVQQGTAYITAGDGTAYVLDDTTLEQLMHALVEGKTQSGSESGADDNELLTTGDAAQILGVSPKTVSRILDSGVIPYIRYTKRGNRWVNRADVLAYRERAHKRHRTHLENMQKIATEGNLDDIDYDAYLTKFE